MILTSKPLAVLVVTILFGGIFFSSAMGWWQTESTKEAAVFTSGEYAGQANPADIRGSYTFGDVEKNFGVPAALLAEAFRIQTPEPAAYPVKDLEALYASSPQEVGTASVRLFVAFYLGLPYDLNTAVYLPESAAALLRERNLTEVQITYLEAHTVPNPPVDVKPAQATPLPTVAPEEQPTSQPETKSEGSSDFMVKGKTTFGELLEWGVTREAVEKVLGMSMPDAAGMTIKDFCTNNGLSFETIKPALQAEVDQEK